MSRLLSALAVALLACALRLANPPVLQAEERSQGWDLWPRPAGSSVLALGSSLLSLRGPASQMVRLGAVQTLIGSTAEDILEAQYLCVSRSWSSTRQLQASLREDCTDGLFADEMPAHRVELSAFYMDRTEVTVDEYLRCVAARGCQPLRRAEGASRFLLPGLPVSMVSWAEAQAFCEFRGGRLPTEAEWERAARGQSKLTRDALARVGERGRIFPWGDLYNPQLANHGRGPFRPELEAGDESIITTDASDGFAETAPVGSFPEGATPEGLLDLGGNVAEWVHDLYAEYPKPLPLGLPSEKLVNPRGPASNQSGARVVRGGHFRSGPAWLRGSARGAASPEARRPMLGFRCVRETMGKPR